MREPFDTPPMVAELLKRPRWRAQELGMPIPESEHAISVCLPTWRDNVGYEEEELRVMERVQIGYPRFIYHRYAMELFARCKSSFAPEQQYFQVYACATSAERCRAYVQSQTGLSGTVHPIPEYNAVAVGFIQGCEKAAKNYWQHSGEGVSSRCAKAIVEGRREPDGTEAKREIRRRIAELTGQPQENVFLFNTGMAAIFFALRAMFEVGGGHRSVQFGFPYVDTLKLQEKFGAGTHFFPRADGEDLEALRRFLPDHPVSGVFVEFPSNPLLWSADMDEVSALARQHDVPLVVDDTLGSFVNAQLMPPADVVCTSLTKNFSGTGDVMGGAVVLSQNGPFAERFKAVFQTAYEDCLWAEDAVRLAENSRSFATRMEKINRTAEAVCDVLSRHPGVDRVFYPKYTSAANYRARMKPGSGYGGLFSMVVKDPQKNAPRVYDRLEVCKGPSLGTSYSLACPYTILAHYRELERVGGFGVSPYLIRVAVGLEDAEDMVERFLNALKGL